jgi:AAA+ ATPase superfamily predicted ATPase
LAQADKDSIPFLPDQVGSAWTRSAQIDVVGINPMEKTLILGECKWTRTPNNRKALVQLVEEKAGKIIPRQGNWNVFLVGFSRAGWTSGALAYQEQINQQPPAGKNWKISGMLLVELEQLDQDMQKWTN